MSKKSLNRGEKKATNLKIREAKKEGLQRWQEMEKEGGGKIPLVAATKQSLATT